MGSPGCLPWSAALDTYAQPPPRLAARAHPPLLPQGVPAAAPAVTTPPAGGKDGAAPRLGCCPGRPPAYRAPPRRSPTELVRRLRGRCYSQLLPPEGRTYAFCVIGWHVRDGQHDATALAFSNAFKGALPAAWHSVSPGGPADPAAPPHLTRARVRALRLPASPHTPDCI